MADEVQLLGSSQACRDQSLQSQRFCPCGVREFVRCYPAILETLINDRVFDVLDGDGGVVDAQHARAFARRGAHSAGELGEVVGFVQTLERFLPSALVHQVIPFRELHYQSGSRRAD